MQVVLHNGHKMPVVVIVVVVVAAAVVVVVQPLSIVMLTNILR